MSDPYVGEIRMFGGSFAPVGWAMCQGQLMAISQNDTLFNLIGTTYGGDGQETFGLPNLAGRAPLHQGQGPGISQTYTIGEAAGVESVTLTTQQMPQHAHALIASQDSADQITGANGILATPVQLSTYFTASPDSALNPATVQPVGGNQPHENLQPYLVISFIISLYGIYPTQS
jgi:microcystin-dependent protein